jgi:putative zinc finger/helix-turn-helix YgiT family protein
MTTRIQCPECRASLREQMASLTGSRKGESFVVEMDALVCPRCDFKTVPRRRAAQFAKRIANAYRQKHGLLTSLDLKDMRAALCMTQKQFYDLVGVGEASGKRWELGEVQTRAMDRLVRYAFTEKLGSRQRYRRWGGFEQLQDKLAIQVYRKPSRAAPGMAHGPPLGAGPKRL